MIVLPKFSISKNSGGFSKGEMKVIFKYGTYRIFWHKLVIDNLQEQQQITTMKTCKEKKENYHKYYVVLTKYLGLDCINNNAKI